MKTVEMSFFDGKLFSFTGIGFCSAAEIDQSLEDRYYGPANAMLFILNGVCYAAVEDPDDGYRSSCRNIYIIDDKSLVKKLVTNRFRGVKVSARYCTEDGNDLVILTEVDGNGIAEFGTDYTDEYYPSFVASFRPEEMNVNRKKSVAS